MRFLSIEPRVQIPGAGRADGVDFSKRVVYELKPNNPKAISRGMQQLERYAKGLSQWQGGEWKKILITYNSDVLPEN